METTLRQREFSKALTTASRFVSTRAQLPILSNIALKINKTKCSILATNLETSVAIQIGAKTAKDGEIAVPSRVITELVSNLKSETIDLSSKKEGLTLASDDFKSTIVGLNLSDFPSIPLVASKKTISIDYSGFIDSLNKVLFSVSRDETRANLTGVLFIFDTSGLTLVASDGFRLSFEKINLKHNLKARVIVPKTVLSELVRLGQENRDEKIEIEIDTDNNQVIFVYQNMVISSRLIEGDFPDFERIVPKTSMIQVSLGKGEFADAIKLASVIARDAANVVNLIIKDKFIQLESESSKSGSQEIKVPAKVDGGELKISFNYRFIEELLGYLSSDEVLIEFTQSNAPAVFKVPARKDFFHLIMPVKS